MAKITYNTRDVKVVYFKISPKLSSDEANHILHEEMNKIYDEGGYIINTLRESLVGDFGIGVTIHYLPKGKYKKWMN